MKKDTGTTHTKNTIILSLIKYLTHNEIIWFGITHSF